MTTLKGNAEIIAAHCNAPKPSPPFNNNKANAISESNKPPMTFTRPVGVKESCDVCMPSMKVAESSEIIKNVPTSNMVMTDNIGTISQHLLQVSHSVALNRVSSIR